MNFLNNTIQKIGLIISITSLISLLTYLFYLNGYKGSIKYILFKSDYEYSSRENIKKVLEFIEIPFIESDIKVIIHNYHHYGQEGDVKIIWDSPENRNGVFEEVIDINSWNIDDRVWKVDYDNLKIINYNEEWWFVIFLIDLILTGFFIVILYAENKYNLFQKINFLLFINTLPFLISLEVIKLTDELLFFIPISVLFLLNFILFKSKKKPSIDRKSVV